jgi:hypothetical protein
LTCAGAGCGSTETVFAGDGYYCAAHLFQHVQYDGWSVYTPEAVTCDNCGDEGQNVCWSCYENAGEYISCNNCDRDYGITSYCEQHMPTEGCDECGIEDRRLCNSCALEEWQLTPELPGVVTNDDGTISIGETEIQWQ